MYPGTQEPGASVQAVGVFMEDSRQTPCYWATGSSTITLYPSSVASSSAVANIVTYSPLAATVGLGTGFVPATDFLYRFCVFAGLTSGQFLTDYPQKCGVYQTFTAGY